MWPVVQCASFPTGYGVGGQVLWRWCECEWYEEKQKEDQRGANEGCRLTGSLAWRWLARTQVRKCVSGSARLVDFETME